MPSQPLNSSAVRERLRFMPVPHTLFFGMLVLGALALVFPGQRLGNNLLESTTPNALSLAYLNVWLRADPKDTNARLLLAYQQATSGNPDAATRTLAPLLADPTLDADATAYIQLLQLTILEQYYWQASAPAERDQARTAMATQLAQLQDQPFNVAQLDELTQTCARLGFADQALAFLARRWQLDPTSHSATDDKVATLLLGQGHYQAAASIHFHHMDVATGLDDRRRHFIAGLTTLQAGNLLNDAMRAAQQRWQPLQHDPQTLRFLVHLALAANQPKQASRYAAQLLKQDAVSPEALP